MAKIAYCLMVAAMVFGGSVRAADAVWTATPMSANGDTIRKDGELVYAVAGGQPDGNSVGEITVNGVKFKTIFSLSNYPSGSYKLPFSVDPEIPYEITNLGDQGVSDPGYAQLLGKGFRNESETAMGDYTFTFNGLEEGEKYLVQIVCHRNNSPAYSVTVPEDGPSIRIGGSGWTYGGSFVQEFTAEGESHSVTLRYATTDGGRKAIFNAFQVRKLSGIVTSPNVQSVSSSVSGTTATIDLTGVTIGTDGDAEPANSYAVSYLLDDAEVEQTVEAGLTAENYSFDISDLEDEMTHVCKVIVANDAGLATTNETSFLVNSLARPLESRQSFQ